MHSHDKFRDFNTLFEHFLGWAASATVVLGVILVELFSDGIVYLAFALLVGPQYVLFLGLQVDGLTRGHPGWQLIIVVCARGVNNLTKFIN